jgi:hypothetical protein
MGKTHHKADHWAHHKEVSVGRQKIVVGRGWRASEEMYWLDRRARLQPKTVDLLMLQKRWSPLKSNSWKHCHVCLKWTEAAIGRAAVAGTAMTVVEEIRNSAEGISERLVVHEAYL